MPQSERQMQLLDAIDMLLRDTQEPIHYKELTQVMIDSGLWQNPWGKEHDQILYSALHNDVKRNGKTAGRFLFMGNGVFCTSFIEGVEFIEDDLPEPSTFVSERDPHARPGDMPGEADKRRAAVEHAEENKKCGNCTHLSWDGPNLHSHEAGSCGRYPDSGKSCVLPRAEACPLWKHRTAGQFNADRSNPAELLLEAATMLHKGEMRSRLKR